MSMRPKTPIKANFRCCFAAIRQSSFRFFVCNASRSLPAFTLWETCDTVNESISQKRKIVYVVISNSARIALSFSAWSEYSILSIRATFCAFRKWMIYLNSKIFRDVRILQICLRFLCFTLFSMICVIFFAKRYHNDHCRWSQHHDIAPSCVALSSCSTTIFG